MSRNKIFLLSTLVLAVIAVTLIFTNRKSTINDDFSVNDPETITKIFMTDKNNRKVLLEKGGDSLWMVNKQNEAQFEVVEMLINTLYKMKVREPVSKAAHDNILKRMAVKNVKVEIYQTRYYVNFFNKVKLFPHEKLTKTIYVGDETIDNLGTYMMNGESKKVYIIHIMGFRGFLSPRFSAKEDDWRNRIIFNHKISDIRSVSVETPRYPELSYRIDRNQRDFTFILLKNNQVLSNFDTLKVVDFMSSFSKIGFEAFIRDMNKVQYDTIFRKPPMQIVTLTDMKGKQIVIKTFPRPVEIEIEEEGKTVWEYDKDRLYALINNDKEIVLIQYPIVDGILKTADYFFPQDVNKKTPSVKK